MAIVYYNLGKYSLAKAQCYRTLDYPADSVDMRGFGFSYATLGQIYRAEGNTLKAITSFENFYIHL